MIFLGASLFAAAWVLSALPFLRMNLKPGPHPHEDNDVYEQDLYRVIPVRFGAVLVLQHIFWTLSIVSFAILSNLRIIVHSIAN